MAFSVNRFLRSVELLPESFLDPSRRSGNPRTMLDNFLSWSSVDEKLFGQGGDCAVGGLTTTDPPTSTRSSATIHPGKSWLTGDEPTIEFQTACCLEPQPRKS